MKTSLYSLALSGALVCSATYAQSSVTAYGIIDAGVMTQSNSGTPSAGRTTALVDAQVLPSIYGIKGKEDLGGGLLAGFTLEGGFNSGKGTHNSPGAYQSQVFGREAKVTLGGDWGMVGAGMQFDPALLAAISTEPRGMTNSFSMVEYWIATTRGNNFAGGGAFQGGLIDQNSLVYTYAKSGLYVGVEYGFGGVAGSTTANSTASVGASYGNGGLMVSGGYARDQNADPAVGGASSRIGMFGLGYTFSTALTLRAQYDECKFNFLDGATPGNDVKVWGTGLDWHTSVANKVNLAYYNAKDHGANPAAGGGSTQLALLDVYALSKRTQVFAQTVKVRADANAGASSVIGGVGAYAAAKSSNGNSTMYFGFGVQHAF